MTALNCDKCAGMLIPDVESCFASICVMCGKRGAAIMTEEERRAKARYEARVTVETDAEWIAFWRRRRLRREGRA